MSQQIDDSRRQVVPRWRPFHMAAELRQLDPVRSKRDPTTKPQLQPAPGELIQLQQDWEHNRTPIYAGELIDFALVTGQHEVAADAADFLIREVDDERTREMAKIVLAGHRAHVREPPFVPYTERFRRIAAARVMLRRNPNDPFRWVDLAREYVALGQNGPAERAMRRALAIAPEDRFVLRAATRFFMHIHDPDRAHSYLRRARRTSEDPWLLSAEIVAAEQAKRTSRFIRLGQRMVGSAAIDPRHTAELASALGTLEHAHGSRRKTRQFVDHALIDPTENAVAQVSWLARHTSSMRLSHDKLSVPRAYEAAAWELALEEEYEHALEQAKSAYQNSCCKKLKQMRQQPRRWNAS